MLLNTFWISRMGLPLIAFFLSSQCVWAHKALYQTAQLHDGRTFQAAIDNFAAASRDLDEIAITPSNEWVIVASATDSGPADVVFSTAFPSLVVQKILEFIGQGKHIDVLSFNPAGAWVLVAEELYFVSPGVPQSATLQQQIQGRIDAGQRVTEIVLTDNNAGWVLVSGSYAYMIGVPSGLFNAVYDRRYSKRSIQGISIGQEGRWVLYADQWSATEQVSSSLLAGLRAWPATKARIDHVRLGRGTDYVMYSHGSVVPNLNSAIDRIEYGLQGGLSNIFRRMGETSTPAVSLAVVDRNQLVYARAYGLLENNTQRFALASSPFDVASLSKYIAALGTMRLADAGLLTLATDARSIALQASGTNQLYLWKGFGEGSPQSFGIDPVPLPSGLTMRRLLSHTASLVPHSSTGFRVSDWPPAPPQLFQLLLGFHCSSGSCAFGGGHAVWQETDFGPPGTAYHYAGGGYLVAQAVDEYVTGQSFAQLMQQRVFDPLAMTNTRYVLTPPDAAFENIAAKQHDSNGVVLERGIYPWAAAGGLYTTPKDYVKAMIPVMNEGMTSANTLFLSPFASLLMLTDATPDTSNYGLGIALSQSIVTEVSGTFSHNGAHENRAYGYMTGSPGRDQAIMIVINTEGDAPKALVSEIAAAFRCAYGWTTTGCL